MNATFLVLALLVGGTDLERPSDQGAVISVIESDVELPAGARTLEDYSRNYALLPDGKVIAVYVTPQLPEVRASDGCEVMLEDFQSRPCTEAEEAEVSSQNEAMAARFGQADQSRWFDNYLDLPMMLDGGCDQIEIIYNPKSKMIESAECNGEA